MALAGNGFKNTKSEGYTFRKGDEDANHMVA